MEIILCYFIIYIIEALILLQYASSIFDCKQSKHMEKVIVFALYMLQFLCSLLNYSWLNTFSFFISNLIFFLVCYYIKWYSALFHAAITTCLMTISELVVYSFAPHFSLSVHGSGHILTLIPYGFVSKTLYFLILYFLSNIFRQRNKSGSQSDKVALLLVGVPFSSLVMMVTLFILCENRPLPASVNWLIATSAFLTLAVNLLVFSINSYNQKKSEEFTRLQVSLQNEYHFREYYKLLLEEQENQSMLIHEIRRHLQSIASLNANGQNQKIENYIHDLMGSPGLDSTVRFSSHELLNGILSRYQKLCKDNGISFFADIRSNTTGFISDNDLTVLFGNLLENAYESASATPDSFIEIKSWNNGRAPFTFVSVSNTCQSNPFSATDHKLHTKKPDKMQHGYGIHGIEHMVKKYDGEIRMHFNEEQLSFQTILMLRQPSVQNKRKVS